MPQVEIKIGGRSFEVACQDGEEHYLQSAANMLNTEAAALSNQIGRMPESRMLLMAGLMLADKTAGLEDRLRLAENAAAELQARVEQLEASGAGQPPERIEVPVTPSHLADTLSQIAARAEALADSLETAND